MLALAILATGWAPAVAGSERAKVHVKVKVVRGCTVHTPAARVSLAGSIPVIDVASLLSDCTDDNTPARLTIMRYPAENRTDVATIDF